MGMARAQWQGGSLTRSRPNAWDKTISCSSFFLMYSAERTIPWVRRNRERDLLGLFFFLKRFITYLSVREARARRV